MGDTLSPYDRDLADDQLELAAEFFGYGPGEVDAYASSRFPGRQAKFLAKLKAAQRWWARKGERK